jgi:hypothetical protein
MVFHPNPVDYWRWTHTGLERLFATNGDWASLEERPGAGTAACLGFLLADFVHLLCKRVHADAASRPLVAGLNRAAAAVDARVRDLRDPVPGALFANFHVTAVKA